MSDSAGITLPEWQQTPAQGYLTAAEIAQVDRVMDRLLPEDTARQMPGAVRAGVSNYLTLLLAKSEATTYREIVDWRKLYRESLAALEQWSQSTHGAALTALDDAKIDGLIRGLEQGNLVGFAPAAPQQQTLFKTFLRHMQQGCFGDPRWGGNKGKIMWRALGCLQAPETSEQIQNDPLHPLNREENCSATSTFVFRLQIKNQSSVHHRQFLR